MPDNQEMHQRAIEAAAKAIYEYWQHGSGMSWIEVCDARPLIAEDHREKARRAITAYQFVEAQSIITDTLDRESEYLNFNIDLSAELGS